MKIKLNEIRGGRYFDSNAQEILIDCAEVKKAISERNFEERPMQACALEISEEWKKAESIEEEVILKKTYHVSRIAALCNNGAYKEPVVICKHADPLEEIIDGGHRILAAKCMEESEI